MIPLHDMDGGDLPSAGSQRNRYVVRAAGPRDLASLLALARHLNTVNLPNDEDHVRELLEHSEGSFSGAILDPRRRKYVYVLLDRQRGCAVGTSTLIAQLGRKDAPYIYYEVLAEERYSTLLDRHFHHTVLRLNFSYDGPTELAGLVVDPAYRRAPERLGRLISYARFVPLAAQPELFRPELLAELLPPLLPDGRSHLWEALGRHFTGMTYGEADRLSSRDKTFIRDLFPQGPIYATLLSREARDVIGCVGQQTRGVEKMLRRIGFRYAERIDPFDGGPHFVAHRNDVSLIRDARHCRLRARRPASDTMPPSSTGWALVARLLDHPPYFFGEAAQVTLGSEAAEVDPAVFHDLASMTDEISTGTRTTEGELDVWILPLGRFRVV